MRSLDMADKIFSYDPVGNITSLTKDDSAAIEYLYEGTGAGNYANPHVEDPEYSLGTATAIGLPAGQASSRSLL